MSEGQDRQKGDVRGQVLASQIEHARRQLDALLFELGSVE
jgi:hypothetical protein